MRISKNLIGNRYGEHGQIEMISHELKGSAPGKGRKCVVKCHTCSKDPELYGEGLFESLTWRIKAGELPCGCRKQPWYTQEQYKTLVARVHEARILFRWV